MEITKYTENGFYIDKTFYSLDTIRLKCAETFAQDKVLFTIFWQETRNCREIYEKFILDKKDVDAFKELILDKNIAFSEINGKHSDIGGTIEECDIKVDDNIENIVRFINTYPYKHDYNHSFLEELEDENDYMSYLK